MTTNPTDAERLANAEPLPLEQLPVLVASLLATAALWVAQRHALNTQP